MAIPQLANISLPSNDMASPSFTQLIIQSLPAWLQFFALAFCIGSVISLLFVFSSAAESTFSYKEARDRLWPLMNTSLTVIFAASIVDLLMRAAEMSGKPFPVVLPVLPTVLFRTHFGAVLIIRLAALFLAIATLLITGRHRDSKRCFLFILVLMVIVVLTESATGHPSDKGDFTIPELMDALHLFAISIWGGGLLVLSAVILPVLISHGDQQLFASVAARFSRIAGYAVGVIVATSIYNAWSYVGSIGGVLHTSYGQIVLLKIILFFLLLQLGALNRYVNVPWLKQKVGMGQGRSPIGGSLGKIYSLVMPARSEATVMRFKRSVQVEAVLIMVVLLCAAILKHETPARHLQKMEESGQQMMHSTPGSHWEHH